MGIFTNIFNENNYLKGHLVVRLLSNNYNYSVCLQLNRLQFIEILTCVVSYALLITHR